LPLRRARVGACLAAQGRSQGRAEGAAGVVAAGAPQVAWFTLPPGVLLFCQESRLIVCRVCDTLTTAQPIGLPIARVRMDLDHLIGKNWSAIRQAARAFLAEPYSDAFEEAVSLYAHPAWELRSFALGELGGLAGHDPARWPSCSTTAARTWPGRRMKRWRWPSTTTARRPAMSRPSR
jgi:hypothetical protein